MKKWVLTLFSLLLLTRLAWAAEMPEAPQIDEQYLLGFYTGNGSAMAVREVNGRLGLLDCRSPEDKDFTKAKVYPLTKERYDIYAMKEASPVDIVDDTVKFERDQEGNGITMRIGKRLYTRRFTAGEAHKKFRIKVTRPWAEMEKEALAAKMPNNGATKKADLQDLTKVVTGLKLDLRYAGDDNCFGRHLVDAPKAYLDAEAAQALGRVQRKLQENGLGLVIWEAYRPWYAFKLATLCLPKGSEGMLPKAEEGYPHNTGRSVDVSLYDLQSGENIPMLCDFDVPTSAQYPRFPGGSSLQRAQRDLLIRVMSEEGFTVGKDEWWHFDYLPAEKYQLLNTPISQLN